MALSEEQKSNILADFNTGSFSKRELAKKHSVGVATVSRLTSGLIPSNGTLVEHMADTTIKSKKQMEQFGTLNGTDQNAVLGAVNVKVNKAAAMNIFDNAAMQNQRAVNLAADMLDKLVEEDPMAVLEQLPNYMAIGKMNETNRKQVVGVTQPPEADETDDKPTSKKYIISFEEDEEDE